MTELFSQKWSLHCSHENGTLNSFEIKIVSFDTGEFFMSNVSANVTLDRSEKLFIPVNQNITRVWDRVRIEQNYSFQQSYASQEEDIWQKRISEHDF